MAPGDDPGESAPGLNGPGLAVVPGGLPPLPAFHRPREAVEAELRAALLTPGGPVGVVPPVLAAGDEGGRGKSLVAAAVVRDPEVRAAWPDGIVWLSISPMAEPCAVQAALARALALAWPGCIDSAGGRAWLAEALAGRRILVVLDDVADMAVLQALPREALGLLVVTRDRAVAESLGARLVAVPDLTPAEADRILDALPGADPAAGRAALVAAAGGRPLALVLRALAGTAATAPGDPLAGAIELAVAALPTGAADRLADLAVFAPGPPLPAAILAAYWHTDAADAADTLDLLAGRGLVGPAAGHRPIVPRAVAEWLRRRCAPARRRHLNRRLVDAYRRQAGPGWADLVDDGYVFGWLPWHAHQAGAADLLHEPGWLAARLRAGGLAAVVADFEQWGAGLTDPVCGAMVAAAAVLAEGDDLLAGQVAGRLADRAQGDRWAAAVAGPWLWPRRPIGGGPHDLAPGRGRWVRCLAASADGARVVSATWDGWLQVWDPAGATPLWSHRGHPAAVAAAAFRPDDQGLVSADLTGRLRFWDGAGGAQLGEARCGVRQAAVICLDAASDTVVYGRDDGLVALYDLRGRERGLHRPARAPLNTLAVAWRARRLATGHGDGSVVVCDLDSGREIARMSPADQAITALAFDPDGTMLAIGLAGGGLLVCRADDAEPKAPVAAHGGSVTALALAGERFLISGGGDGMVRLWAIQDLAPMARHLECGVYPVTAVCLLAEGQGGVGGAVAGDQSGQVQILDLMGC